MQQDLFSENLPVVSNKPKEEPKPEPKPEKKSTAWVPKMVNGEWEIY